MQAIEQFKELKMKYDERLGDLLKERQELVGKIDTALADYQRAEIANFENDTKATRDVVTKTKKLVDSLREELQAADDRIDTFKQMRNERLKGLYPELEKEFVEVQQQTRKEIAERADELKQKRCEFLLAARDLHNVGNEARRMYTEIGNIASAIGVKFGYRFDLPALPMTTNYTGVFQNLAPLPNEVTEAYQLGKVPAFVELFGLTGEIVEDNEARRRLAEIKKGGK